MGELRQMPAAEFTRWLAFYSYEDKARKDAERKAR